jgi:hypothetical protein
MASHSCPLDELGMGHIAKRCNPTQAPINLPLTPLLHHAVRIVCLWSCVMTAAAKPTFEFFSFGGEDAGVAAATALRKVRPLAEAAPPGRLFAAIATLADNSAAAAHEYEMAGVAELQRETEEAEARLSRATQFVHRLKTAIGAEVATPLPAFIRRK